MYSTSSFASRKFIGTKTRFRIEQANINSQNEESFFESKAILSPILTLFFNKEEHK
jgi:hypothetical protein